MASVCAASLSLMDAGVPLKASCAGVAMGLVKEGERFAVLTDILGLEDALGDMDFKVAGTRKGVTAIQMDIKMEGLDLAIMREALGRARTARRRILDAMDHALPAARTDLSQYAPRIISISINPEKIGEIIGPKGKTIRAIQDETGAKIDIEDSGVVKVAAVSGEAGVRAREMIEAIAQEPEVGRVYEGPVKNTTTFGAFIEIFPGTEGLCHISELAEGRVGKTEDVLKVGEITRVKLLAIDEKGRLRLSRRAALADNHPGRKGVSGPPVTSARSRRSLRSTGPAAPAPAAPSTTRSRDRMAVTTLGSGIQVLSESIPRGPLGGGRRLGPTGFGARRRGPPGCESSARTHGLQGNATPFTRTDRARPRESRWLPGRFHQPRTHELSGPGPG